MTNLRPREYKAQRLKVTEVANHDFGSGYFSAESTVAISEQRFEAQATRQSVPLQVDLQAVNLTPTQYSVTSAVTEDHATGSSASSC
jgi:hypothetical protein